MVRVEHRQTRVVVTFTGEVTQEGIIELVSTINRLQTDYFYRRVDLHIASPGGEVIALDYFIEAISYWKQQDLILTTRALTACSSAAAVMLSLGDQREASASSLLHYHNSRVSGQEPMTSDIAEEVGERLKAIDERILAKLVDQVMQPRLLGAGASEPVDAIVETDGVVLKQMRLDWSMRTNEHPGAESDDHWLESWLNETRETVDGKEVRARWERLYDTLLDQDLPISATLAVKLGLVDRLIEPTSRRWGQSTQVSDGHWFTIPEWEAAYPYGRLEERHLRRHALILGETGSGKTRSAILPTLAAAYRSPRVGVGLVIDPKRELGSVLDEWDRRGDCGFENKKLVWIKADNTIIDLMGNSTWSLGKMVKDHEYYSAAQQILRRIASLTESNPARILLGEQLNETDPYWPQEGTMLASTVVALAIEFMACPGNYKDLESEWLRNEHRMLAVAVGRLHAIGVRLGMFEDWRGKYVREVEESANGDADGDGDRMDDVWAFAADDLGDIGGLYESEEYDRGDECAGADSEQRRRACALDNLLEKLDRTIVLEGERDQFDPIDHRWKKSERLKEDFDFTLQEIKSKILLKARESHVPNVLVIASAIFEELFAISDSEIRGEGNVDDPLHALAKYMRRERAGGEYDVIAQNVKKYADMRSKVEKQYAGVYGSASTVWQAFVSREIRDSIYFGCEMQGRNGAAATGRRFLEFQEDVAKTEEQIAEACGRFYIYQPALSDAGGLIAKACKALFFEAILGDEERAVNGEKMPMAAYIADEFQRFITVDHVHGEQSFLDVCRSFGAFTVIACQSVASLQYALCSYESDSGRRNSAIDIICNNTGTKIFFRSTDGDTSARLDTICPAIAGGDLVTRLRPLSTLEVGECYASFPDGQFVRIQLKKFPAS